MPCMQHSFPLPPSLNSAYLLVLVGCDGHELCLREEMRTKILAGEFFNDVDTRLVLVHRV